MIEWLTRRIWGFCLWLMRRPWMRALQRGPMKVLPERKHQGVRDSIRRQNLLGLKYGRRIIRTTLWVCWVILLIQATYVFAALYASNLAETANSGSSLRQ